MNLLPRRRAVVFMIVGVGACGAVLAQGYPNRAIRLVIANPPGGLTDTVARILAPRLQEAFNQPIVIDNKPGANGGNAAALLLSSPADGYTYLVADGSMLSVNPLVASKLAYDPARDFTPASLIGKAPLFLAVRPDLKVDTLEQLIALAKARPGALTYGSSGVGSTHHLTMEALKAATGVFITHIPYRGSAASVPALLGGQVDMVFSAYPSLAGFVKAGQLKLLASNAGKRSLLAPEVPAIAERIADFDFAPNIILLARSGTPAEAIARIDREVARIAKRGDAADAARTAGFDLVGDSAAALGQALQAEIERMARVAKQAGLKPE